MSQADVPAPQYDCGVSGVGLKHRSGLRQLLEDVVGVQVGYNRISVAAESYDIREEPDLPQNLQQLFASALQLCILRANPSNLPEGSPADSLRILLCTLGVPHAGSSKSVEARPCLGPVPFGRNGFRSLV
jgi:hypothetical protein